MGVFWVQKAMERIVFVCAAPGRTKLGGSQGNPFKTRMRSHLDETDAAGDVCVAITWEAAS